MALKLPWKYKSLIAIVNSYRDGEEDINRAKHNNFSVTGSLESFHPLTFFHFSTSATGRGRGRADGWWMVPSAFKFHFPQQSHFFPPLSLNSAAPFHLFLLSLCLPVFLYSSANPFKASIRASNQLMFLWCQRRLELLSGYLLILLAWPSLSRSLSESLSSLVNRTTGSSSIPAGLSLCWGWHISGSEQAVSPAISLVPSHFPFLSTYIHHRAFFITLKSLWKWICTVLVARFICCLWTKMLNYRRCYRDCNSAGGFKKKSRTEEVSGILISLISWIQIENATLDLTEQWPWRTQPGMQWAKIISVG